MLFKRDKPPSRWRSVLDYIWPKIGFKRAWLYLWHRVRRIADPPHAVALGFAIGAFMSFTPLFGFHIVLAAVIAFLVGGNVLASAIGTFVGNPFTFPFIWLGTFNLGAVILGREGRYSLQQELEGLTYWSAVMEPGAFFSKSVDLLEPILLPMLVGSIPLGFVCALLSYSILRPVVKAYKERRQNRLREFP